MNAPVPVDVVQVDVVRPGSRLARARRPRAKDVLRDLAVEFGVCVRPVLLRRTDADTGETTVVEVPCASTRAAQCPPCADRARRVRAQQCREGWHLHDEPDLTPDPATARHKQLAAERAQITDARDDAREARDEGTVQACEQALTDVDADLADAGVRGSLDPDKAAARRTRSTRRRDDVPDLPRRPSTGASVGRLYTDPKTGATFRPSLFVTLTLGSYGRVDPDDGTPLDPRTYDYPAAARDALHFGKLLDRWAQNLRRVAGYDVQYFAAVEPQRRAAPHAHYAIRGTLPRALVRELTAATYVNVWWPPTHTPCYDTTTPVWEPEAGTYVDPHTGHPLTDWTDALDAVHTDPDARPTHTLRFGTQVDVQGVLAGTPRAEKAIGYLVKYLVKDLGADLTPGPDDHDGDERDDHERDGDELAARRRVTAQQRATAARRADHVARLVEALRYEPCAPTCANWLRYGVVPKNPRPAMRAGCCRAKAHRPTHLGYGGRRVLVSRRWTGKDLADHRHDRHAHVLATLGQPHTDHGDGEVSATTPHYLWEIARPTDPDIASPQHRLLLRIAEHVRRRTEYHQARDGTPTPEGTAQQQVSATNPTAPAA